MDTLKSKQYQSELKDQPGSRRNLAIFLGNHKAQYINLGKFSKNQTLFSEPWNHSLDIGNHPLKWPNISG